MIKLFYKLPKVMSYSCMGILGQLPMVGLCLGHADGKEESTAAIDVSGTVTSSADGVGIPGVNVLVKNTGTGTV